MTGPLYVPLHEYFQQQADVYLQQADPRFAERVLHLGAPSVDGRFSHDREHDQRSSPSTLPTKLPFDRRSRGSRLLLDRVTVLQKEVYDLIGGDGGERPADG